MLQDVGRSPGSWSLLFEPSHFHMKTVVFSNRSHLQLRDSVVFSPTSLLSNKHNRLFYCTSSFTYSISLSIASVFLNYNYSYIQKECKKIDHAATSMTKSCRSNRTTR